MSIFNILDDVYDVESPMEKIMSAAKKKKDKSVTVTKKEKDPFLDGFNLFANEEKKEKSHLDSVSNRGKSKNTYIMPQGSWWRKLSGENEVQKAAGENAARKKQEQANREQSKAPVAKKKDPFLDGFNQNEEEEKKERQYLDFVKSGGKSKVFAPGKKEWSWLNTLSAENGIRNTPQEKKSEEKGYSPYLKQKAERYLNQKREEREKEELEKARIPSPRLQKVNMYRAINQQNKATQLMKPQGPNLYPELEKWGHPISSDRSESFYSQGKERPKPNSFRHIGENGEERPVEVKKNYNGDPTFVILPETREYGKAGKTLRENLEAMENGVSLEEWQKFHEETTTTGWGKGKKEYVVDEYGNVYELPRWIEPKNPKMTKVKPLLQNINLDDLEKIFAVAEWIPGLDNLASAASAVVNLLQGDFKEAMLDGFGAIPFANEVKHGVKAVDTAVDFAKGAKKAGKGLGLIDEAIDVGKAASKTSEKLDEIIDLGKAADKIDDAYDFGKIADRIDDTYDAARAAKDSADMARKRLPEEIMNPTKPITSVTDNYDIAKAYQSPNGNGMFGIKGKNSRIYKSSDQYESAADFYARISRGGKERELGQKGITSIFDDGSRVMYRVVTSTIDSPAVEIQIVSRGKIQKIHFILEGLKWSN